jgi:hypothetical protein
MWQCYQYRNLGVNAKGLQRDINGERDLRFATPELGEFFVPILI